MGWIIRVNFFYIRVYEGLEGLLWFDLGVPARHSCGCRMNFLRIMLTVLGILGPH